MNIQTNLLVISQNSIGLGEHSIEQIYSHIKSLGYPIVFISDTSMDIFLETNKYKDLISGYRTKVILEDKISECILVPNNLEGYYSLLKICPLFEIKGDIPFGIKYVNLVPILDNVTVLLLDDKITSLNLLEEIYKMYLSLNDSEKDLFNYFLNKPRYEQQIQLNNFPFMEDVLFSKLKVFISKNGNLIKVKEMLKEQTTDSNIRYHNNIFKLNIGDYNRNNQNELYSSDFINLNSIKPFDTNETRDVLPQIKPFSINKSIQSYSIKTGNVTDTFKSYIVELIEKYRDEPIGIYLEKALNDDLIMHFFSKINTNKIIVKEIDYKRINKLIKLNNLDLEKVTEKQKKELAKKFNLYVENKEFLYNKSYRDRLSKELKEVIDNGVTNFLSYFLTIKNIIDLAREDGLKIGDGRGSAVASLICYLLDITNIDPLVNNLNFKRFLQRSRFGNLNLIHTDLEFNESSWDKKHLLTIEDLNKNFINFDTNSDWMEIEYTFIIANPSIINYLLYLKEKNKFFIDNDSSIIYALGLGDKPTRRCSIKNLHPPDIDIDVNDRNRLLELIELNYGIENTCQISVYNYYKMHDLITDTLKKNVNISTKQIELIISEFKKEKGKDELEVFKKVTITNATIRRFFSVYDNEKQQIIQGYNKLKSISVHPSGVIICNEPVYHNFPVYKRSNNRFISFNDKNTLEEFGFLKLDFLNLETLNELKLVEYLSNVKAIDIQYNDPKVFEAFMMGDTDYIFQCKSNLVKDIFKKTKKIKSILDLAILMSAARPGPMKIGADKELINLINTGSQKEHSDRKIQKILSDSYGMVLFQEHIIEISDYIGMSEKDSINIMYAIKNKNINKIKSFKDKFIKKGLLTTKNDSNYLTKLWDDMEQFGSYGFNKAHAIAYATISYQCMFYQVYFKKEWITSLLNTGKNNINDIYLHYDFIKKPERNSDPENFILVNNEIISPTKLLKKINNDHIQWIKHFYGKNIDDLKSYLKETLIKFKDFELIVLSGLLDHLIEEAKGRYSLLSLFKAHKEYTNKFSSFENTDFRNLELEFINLPLREKLTLEEINKLSLNNLFKSIDDTVFSTDQITYFGTITKVKKLKIKKDGENKGKNLILGQMSINSNLYEFTIFPDAISSEIKEKEVIIFTGYKNKEGKIIINKYIIGA